AAAFLERPGRAVGVGARGAVVAARVVNPAAAHGLLDRVGDPLAHHPGDLVGHLFDDRLGHHLGDRVGHLLDAGVRDLLADRVGHPVVDAFLHAARHGDGLADGLFLPDLLAARLRRARLGAADQAAGLGAGLAGAGVEGALAGFPVPAGLVPAGHA